MRMHLRCGFAGSVVAQQGRRHGVVVVVVVLIVVVETVERVERKERGERKEKRPDLRGDAGRRRDLDREEGDRHTHLFG